eukprot:275188_1
MMQIILILLANCQLILSASESCISPDIVYAIKSISSGNYLDGRAGERNPTLGYKNLFTTSNRYIQWNVINLGSDQYALQSISSGNYLDGRAGERDPALGYKNAFTTRNRYIQWTFVQTDGGDCNVAIKSTSSGNYLDGRGGELNPTLGYKNSFTTSNIYIQWVFIPINYKLSAVISNFDFDDDIENILDNNKQVAFADVAYITAQAVGIESSGTYGESIEESFSFGFSETLGIGIEVEIEAGIPLIGGASTTVSSSFEFSANQQWTTTYTNNFEQSWSFTPLETGIFEVWMTCYVVKNQELPFEADVIIKATTDDTTKLSYTGNQIVSLLKYRGFDATITYIGNNYAGARITGSITANFGVKMITYSKRIGDIPTE